MNVSTDRLVRLGAIIVIIYCTIRAVQLAYHLTQWVAQ